MIDVMVFLYFFVNPDESGNDNSMTMQRRSPKLNQWQPNVLNQLSKLLSLRIKPEINKGKG